MGASAGGHLVALMGTAGDSKEFAGYGRVKNGSSRVQCVVDLFGPTDLTRMQEQSGGRGTIDHDSANAPEARLIGGPVQQNKGKAAKANPISYVTKDDPPFLILHGDQDPLVPVGQSELLHAALKMAGVESELVVIPGAGHGGKEFHSDARRKQVADFFDKHLKK
jgi:dipeptidyl aminopeptidase/acylaminoacyl peptidase